MIKAAVWSSEQKVNLVRIFETEEPAVQACNHGNRGCQITKMAESK